jgi:ferric iron reductase protein FhuF
MKLLKIVESDKPEKKMMAVFETESGRTKTIHFGQKGADDYTITKNKEQMERYLNRHRSTESWDKADSAGALSRYVLWSATSVAQGIRNYKKRFNL